MIFQTDSDEAILTRSVSLHKRSLERVRWLSCCLACAITVIIAGCGIPLKQDDLEIPAPMRICIMPPFENFSACMRNAQFEPPLTASRLGAFGFICKRITVDRDVCVLQYAYFNRTILGEYTIPTDRRVELVVGRSGVILDGKVTRKTRNSDSLYIKQWQ